MPRAIRDRFIRSARFPPTCELYAGLYTNFLGLALAGERRAASSGPAWRLVRGEIGGKAAQQIGVDGIDGLCVALTLRHGDRLHGDDFGRTRGEQHELVGEKYRLARIVRDKESGRGPRLPNFEEETA